MVPTMSPARWMERILGKFKRLETTADTQIMSTMRTPQAINQGVKC
jgi:hypothetical protein